MSMIIACILGSDYHQIHWQLCELLSGTDIREVLDSVHEEEDLKYLYRCYLRDYIMSKHQVPHNKSSLEYKVRININGIRSCYY